METRLRKISDDSSIIHGPASAGIWVGQDSGLLKYNPDGSVRTVPQVLTRGKTYFVDTVIGSDSNRGLSPNAPFATVDAAFDVLANKDTIVISGVVREQLTAPQDVFDVTIIGAATNTPRQATEDGVATGAGATWLAPETPASATPLLTLREQGWRLQNIFMAADTDAACVKLRRAESDAVRDASHFAAYGCVFGGGLYGIQDDGGNGYLRLGGNVFQNFSGASAYAVRNTSASVANPLQWIIEDNLFRNNKNHIVAPFSQAHIKGNDFGIVGNTVTTVIALSATGGLNNTVVKNFFNRPLNTSPNATLFVGGTDDLWYENYGTDGIFYGVPDNS